MFASSPSPRKFDFLHGFTAIVLGASLFSGNLFANGSGARGGGTGVVCEGKKNPILIEEYMLDKSGIVDRLPEDRNLVLDWLRPRFSVSKKGRDLFKEFSDIWNRIGPYSSWNHRPLDEVLMKSNTLVASDQMISITLAEMLRSMNVKLPESRNDSNLLVQDDFTSLDANCKKVQLSILADKMPIVVYEGSISAQTERYLEVHEAFYFLGLDQYQHQLPAKTRNLIVAAHVESPLSKKAIDAFRHVSKGRDVFVGKNSVLILSNGELSRTNDLKALCPLVMSFLYDGDVYQVLSLELENGKLIVRTRHPLPPPKQSFYAEHGNLLGSIRPPSRLSEVFFPYDEPAIFPGSTAILDPNPFKGNPFILAPYKTKEIKQYRGFIIPPNPDETSPEESVSQSLSCDYYSWSAGKTLDANVLTKAWNAYLLNQK